MSHHVPGTGYEMWLVAGCIALQIVGVRTPICRPYVTLMLQ